MRSVEDFFKEALGNLQFQVIYQASQLEALKAELATLKAAAKLAEKPAESNG